MLVCEIHAFPIPCYLCSFLSEEELLDAPQIQRQTKTEFNKTQDFRDHWRELHTKRNATIEWLLDWIARIPPGCGCGESFESILQRLPPRFDDWFAWTVEIHNQVNRKLSKPEITLEKAIELWQHVK